jgi:hypothetical protein
MENGADRATVPPHSYSQYQMYDNSGTGREFIARQTPYLSSTTFLVCSKSPAFNE